MVRLEVRIFQARHLIGLYAILTRVIVLLSLSYSSIAFANQIHDKLSQEFEHFSKTTSTIHFSNKKQFTEFIIDWHHALLESNFTQLTHTVSINLAEKQLLQAQGLVTQPGTQWLQKRQQKLHRLKYLNNLKNSKSGTIPDFPCYQTVESSYQSMQALVSDNDAYAHIEIIGESERKQTTGSGYDLQVLVLSDRRSVLEKHDVFFQAGMHAREYATSPLLLRFAQYLMDNKTDPNIEYLLNRFRIHLLIHSNPDGRKYAEQGLFWRKNGNLTFCKENTSRQGVDLNRNFSFKWGEVPQGSSSNECAEDFRGPAARSEPETLAVENYLSQLFSDQRGPDDADAAPDLTSGIHLDIHSYGQLVLWPWGHNTQSRSPNELPHKVLAYKVANINGATPQQSAALYPTDGTSEGASYGDLGVAHLTFEIGTEFFQSCQFFEETLLPKQIKALEFVVANGDKPYSRSLGPRIHSLTQQKAGDSWIVMGSADNLITSEQVGNDSANIASIQLFTSMRDASLDQPKEQVDAQDAASALGSFQFSLPSDSEPHIIYIAATSQAGHQGPIVAFKFEGRDAASDEQDSENNTTIPDATRAGGSLGITFFLVIFIGIKLYQLQRIREQ